LATKTVLMRNWLAGIIAFFGLIFFFFVQRNLLGFIVLIICAVGAAILFSESEMDERIRRIREDRQERRRKREKASSQRQLAKSAKSLGATKNL